MHRVSELLLEALDKLYANGGYDPRSVLITPSGRTSITRHVPKEDRQLVALELARWQAAYLEGVGPDTQEGRWLATRPLTVRVDDLVFVHGGVHPTATQAELDEINTAFAETLLPSTDLGALEQLLSERPEIRELVEDRRLHKSCNRVQRALASLNATLIAVGHTPDYSVRSTCQNGLLALDSSLSRWFRSSGNFYCSGTWIEARRPDEFCPRMSRRCEGQVVRMQRGSSLDAWKIEYIGMDESDEHVAPVGEDLATATMREELR